MGRNPKFSKEIKIKVCEDYIRGYKSFKELAKSIGCSYESLRHWYLVYRTHGANTFATSKRNSKYTKEFKESVINLYLNEKYSLPDLSAKYNISHSVIRKWVNKYYNGIEQRDYDPKGDIYTMKSRKTTFEERLEIVKWVIANDMNYKEAESKYTLKYALIYKWTKAYLKEGVVALQYKKRGLKSNDVVDEDSLSDIEKLKLELEREKALRERVEFELEVIKKRRNGNKNTLSKVRQEASYLTIDYYQELGYSITIMCKVLDIARSAYYKHKKRIKPKKEKTDELLCSLIKEYHATFDGILGYRRMTIFINRLNQQNFSEKYIHRLMKLLSISARIRRKKVNRKKTRPDYVKENILNRDFKAQKPNEKWLTDVTEFSISGDSKHVACWKMHR